MLDLTEAKRQVDYMLSEYCAEKVKVAKAAANPGYEQLWQEIESYIGAGGKRLRPYLVLLTHGAYTKSEGSSMLPVACAWELLHACLLVHDDIIDRDIVRHNVLNIAGKYQARYGSLTKKDTSHYALSAALLAGDLLLSSAYDIINSSDLTLEQKAVAQSCLQAALFSVAGGELADVESSLYKIGESDPIAVANSKTATYSFQLPMLCGARLAHAPATEQNKLEQLGLEMGIAFQLRDDLLGIFGEQDQTGKSNRSDIYEKKRTLLVKTAYEYLPVDQAARLDELFHIDKTINEAEAEEIFHLIQLSGAKDIIELQIAKRAKSSHKLAVSLRVDETYKTAFIHLIDKLSVRSK